MNGLEPFLEATVRMATPLALAALGEMFSQRGGVINIGLEGVVLTGAFGALVGASTGSVAAGFAAGMVAGCALNALFALLTVTLRADQIITGAAINLIALGLTGALYRAMYGAAGAALSIPTAGVIAVPLLSQIPIVGPALFMQPAPTYALYALVPLAWWWLTRTHAGLALRATGERAESARVAGLHPSRYRWGALLVAGALGGAAGATLVVAQAGTFVEGMSAGRGFIAIAIVVLGRWHPGGVALAALLFGAASALQFFFQALGLAVAYHLILAVPYVLTLLALAGVAGRTLAPEGLGRS